MTVTHYIYDGFQLLGEADENNDMTRLYINEPDEFTHPIGQVDLDTDEPAYYHHDGQGNTTAVTDEIGDVTDTFDYDSWGNVLARTGTTNVPFQFGGEHGYYKDEELDSYYVMARTYNPMLARWLSLDTAGFIDGMNLYTYVSNAPSISADASGLVATKNNCDTIEEKHHWFPQFKKPGDKKPYPGQKRVNEICTNINIDDYTTPIWNSRLNTPHWFLTNPFQYSAKAKDIADKFENDCCLFLVAMIDLIHQAYDAIRDKLPDLNQARLDDCCPPTEKPKCRMQNYKYPANKGDDTKGDLIQKANAACAGKSRQDIPSSSLRWRIQERETNLGSGCDGLGDPMA